MYLKLLLGCLLVPFFVYAQEVEPIESPDYLSLINRDTVTHYRFLPDTTNGLVRSLLKYPGVYTGYSIKWIRQHGNVLSMKPEQYRYIALSGSFYSSVEIKKANRMPVLQNRFVQGRSQNGTLAWNGPETGELFSFGPEAASLEFDGSNYAYDRNGRLVPAGTGNGKQAMTYNNAITRTATLLSQRLTIQARYLAGAKQVLAGTFKFGQTNEQTLIRGNRNSTGNFSTTLTATIRDFIITGTVSASRNKFSNSNRNGFLNRVYQNALLTPVSFDNRQGTRIGAFQRSYAGTADNPYFLLDNDNFFDQQHRTGSLAIQKKISGFTFKLMQSLQRLSQKSREAYAAGTAFFPAGMMTDREKQDATYYLQADVIYEIPHYNYAINSQVEAGYIFTGNRSSIGYTPGLAYNYRRSSHNVAISYTVNYQRRYWEAGGKLTNGMYASNTVEAGSFFLPSVLGYVRYSGLFDSDVSIKLSGGFNSFSSELPVHQSYAQSNLLQYTTAQALRYYPVTEVTGFGNLKAIQHRQWSVKTELNYRNRLILYAELFDRQVKNDVFALSENGLLHLRNLASHRNKGVEFELVWYKWSGPVSTTNSLSFFHNTSRVTAVEPGYPSIPVAGFSNIYKAVIKGAPLGVIAGRGFVRDAGNNLVIGNDGFPLADPSVRPIGNPIPDFVMKLANNISWKKLQLNVAWEWQKGGQVWNGTQAVLDYYGRSKASGDLRNTNGYIFPGVTQAGHPNTTPVQFYDPSLPVENNRWTRYGFGGVDEEYIQKADYFRINNLALSYTLSFRRHVQRVLFTLYAHNIMVWSAYKGGDPNQLLYDQPNTEGLDFFNLPSVKTVGFTVSVQF